MSNQECRLPPTPTSCPSSTRTKKSGSGSSRNSNSPIHWGAVTGALSHKITKTRPSSWDSDDELPIIFDSAKGHIYSREARIHRKSVTAEIDELKKQFFESSAPETEMEDLKERSDLFLGNDRRQSPARVRRRSKSSSSSSTAMDSTLQNSPKGGEDIFPQETLFDNVENFAPLLELNSKFYLDTFFSELRRRRISMLESAVGFDNERDEDDYQENSDEFINLNNCAYYSRTCRKLSQILEVEENKKDSDKDVEECSENGDLFFEFSRKSEDINSPQETASYEKNEGEFRKAEEYELKSANVEVKNSIKSRETNSLKKNCGSNEEIISLTAKTGMIHLSSPREDEKQEDVNLQCHSTIEDFYLVKSAKPTSRRSLRRERNSRSSSRKSSRDGDLESPKFIINLGKETSRSLKLEDVKTPHSVGKSSTQGSDRSVKNYKSICPSEPDQEKNSLDPKSSSLASNQSLELQDILLDQEMTGRYGNCGESSVRSEFSTKLPFRSERSSRSSRSSRLHFQRSEMEETESRRSSITPRTEPGVEINTPRLENYTSRSREESKKSSLRGLQIEIGPIGSCNVTAASKGNSEDFDNEGFSEWVHQSSRSEILKKENLDNGIGNDSVEELAQSSKSVFTGHLENLDYTASNRSVKKFRSASCTSEEPLNIEKSDELKITGRSSDRSIIEECESTGTQTSKNDSETDRRQSVVKEEIIIECPELSKYGSNRKMQPKDLIPSHRSAKEKSSESARRPKCEGLWNDLIETFTEDQKQPFSWEDNFTNFLNKKNVINSGREASSGSVIKEIERGKEEEIDFIMSGKLTENVSRSPRKSQKISSPGKGSNKKEDFLDLDAKNNPRKKIKSDSETLNLYYFKVKKTGNFGIGEYGDVTCWNLGTSVALQDPKPKGHGDGIEHPVEKTNLNQEHWENNSKCQRQLRTNVKDTRINSKAQKSYRINNDLNLKSIFQGDLKPSKSDSSVNATEFANFPRVDSSNQKFNKSNVGKPSIFENPSNGNLKPDSSVGSLVGSLVGSVKNSSSECLSDETDNQEFDREKVRRTASLVDITAELSKTGHKKPGADENLYNSKRGFFQKPRIDARAKHMTNLNIFLAGKAEENSKSNWLTLRQKAYHRENKSTLKIDKSLIKKDSEKYLSFRTRHPLPVFKLRDSNCFQNFYKRLVSVFCTTPNSCLPTPK